MIRLKQKENRDNVFQMLIASMLSIVVCTVCLVGGTFAWFTATETISTQDITAGNFEVQAVVTESEISSGALEEGEISTAFMSEEDDGSYLLSSEKEYSVMLNVNGTVTQGFCIIKIGDDYKYTEPIILEEGKASYTFSITAYEAADFSVIPCWGTVENNPEAAKIASTYDMDESLFIGNGSNLVIGTPSVEKENLEEETEIAYDFMIDDHIGWNPLVEWEDQLIYPNRTYSIAFRPSEGYRLFEVIVKIDESTYDVYPDGSEQGVLSEEQTELLPMLTVDEQECILTIPAALLTKDTELVQIYATAVADEPEGEVTEDEPEGEVTEDVSVQGETEVLPEQVEPTESVPPVSQNESVDAQVQEPSVEQNTPVNPQMPSETTGQPDAETSSEPTEPSNTETPSESTEPSNTETPSEQTEPSNTETSSEQTGVLTTETTLVPEDSKPMDEEITEDTEKVIKSTDSEETTELPEIEE